VDVEEILRWTYQDQAADTVTARVVSGLYPAGCRSNLLTVQRNGQLGTQIDCSGNDWQGGNDLHPDAETVHDAVCCLSPLEIGLVIHHAKTAGRPDCMAGKTPRPVPVLRGNGKPLIEYHDAAGRRPSHCVLRYDPEPGHVEFLRETYLVWWGALAILSTRLDLEDTIVTGPDAPRMPWQNKPR
jgi:hypothetical protein